MKKEIWKDIEGYEGLYQISDLGRVKSLYDGGHDIFRDKILKPQNDKNGYQRVDLHKSGKRKNMIVHRLVAIAFLDNPNCYPEVNHKDEDKTNNTVDNLEWCSPQYNANYGTRNKRSSDARSIKIDQFDLQGNFIKSWKSSHDIERSLGFYQTNIIKCCKGKLKTSSGYIWKYHE